MKETTSSVGTGCLLTIVGAVMSFAFWAGLIFLALFLLNKYGVI